MAVQDKSKAILNMNYLESKNKVYINPNFNRSISNLPNSTTMHVNPKFSHIVSNGQSTIQNKNKIFINPNFVKSRSVSDSNRCISTSVNDHDSVIIDRGPDVLSAASSSLTTYQHSVYKEPPVLSAPVAKSRYCLVRQNVTNKPLNEPVKNTFKLNKYKTVSWKDVKRNLDNVKIVTNSKLIHLETNFQTTITGKGSNSLVHGKNTKFKLINCNNATSLKHDKINTKINKETSRKLYKSNQVTQIRMKKTKGNLKKNNIPCPLFRKYGKCLRNARGRCEFLHDKKHVSICRKFIKGLCHDKECLLSHDLTTKKMPTCYFYLQGTCTKVECPYLHVKLNEKTKICPDFVKGYCEKGSKCLQRHINISTEKKKPSFLKRESFRNKYNKTQICQGDMKKQYHQTAEVPQNIEKTSVNSENRYYDEDRDAGSVNESYETIKPMRCKLGTLPSFIQL